MAARRLSGRVYGLILKVGTDALLGDMPFGAGQGWWRVQGKHGEGLGQSLTQADREGIPGAEPSATKSTRGVRRSHPSRKRPYSRRH
jgi:hypothetical protein